MGHSSGGTVKQQLLKIKHKNFILLDPVDMIFDK